MKLKIAKLTRILIVLVFIATEVDAIKCYQCNSVYDQDCRLLKSDRVHKLIMDCDIFQKNNLTASFCRSVYQKSYSGDVRLTRSCGFRPQMKLKTNQCTRITFGDSTYSNYCECTTDLCNNASKFSFSYLILFVILISIAQIIRNFLES
ncbi:unnamed protein product [Chironomus riparius]|uniref:Protein sleepless n=1 Tax=Chironomus riparius TaxID=315576 RepID=A0A9N9RSN5_9DIPT|nr:unnamed protein product [Chironomus riparius]